MLLMLPLALDPSRLRIALVGEGARALQRLAWLDESGAAALTVYADAPSVELVARAGDRLVRHWPDREALAATRLVFIADPPMKERYALVQAARNAGAILHVEDEPALCDVHAPAILRRGELTFAISTGGSAPSLAAELKQFLAGLFGPEWGERLDEISTLRRSWRGSGATQEIVRHRTAARIARQGWFEAIRASVAKDGRFAHESKGDAACP